MQALVVRRLIAGLLILFLAWGLVTSITVVANETGTPSAFATQR